MAKILSPQDLLHCTTEIVRYGIADLPEIKNILFRLQNNIGCTYIFYVYEDFSNNKTIYFSTNWAWQSLFIGEKLLNHCPLFTFRDNFHRYKKTGSFILPWDSIVSSNAKERDVCGLRADFNIAHGISYSSKSLHVSEAIGFAGEKDNNKFYENFIIHPLLYMETLQSIRTAILSKNHRPTNHQNVPYVTALSHKH